MKLSKEQLDAVFELISKEVNSQNKVAMRDISLGNKKREQEAVEKFKKTKEYEAVVLLAKAFPKTYVDWSKKDKIESLAHWMFKPERKSTFISSWDARKVIALLSIDCKNFAELKDKINKHYNLKNKLK
jgi:hypothetical protein